MMPNRTVALIGSELEENLSLRYLASSVDAAGFESEIFAYNRWEDRAQIIDAVAARNPLVTGISIPFQHRAQELLDLSTELRARGYGGHIVAGGHFATFEYQ